MPSSITRVGAKEVLLPYPSELGWPCNLLWETEWQKQQCVILNVGPRGSALAVHLVLMPSYFVHSLGTLLYRQENSQSSPA